ncbi:oligopeptide ABC transporter permease [Microlunatus speluncae]|uniref:oligopeptide ABC transporter permease n=1 Tax=Microlunatus speluncae TaxID=2594267 RepID=UPI0015838DE7|nr:oligopeptide ABC transporter permease [Microlunatus speluncae]
MTVTPLATERATAAAPTRGGHRSPGKMALRRFLKHRAAVVSLVVLAIIVLAVVGADLIAQFPPNATDLSAIRSKPSAEHWLGTDGTGRDVFARLLHAGRVSLGVGIASAALAVLLGIVLGSLAGMLGGWVDGLIMRLADIFLSFPSLVVMIVLAGILGPSVPTMIIAIGVFQWPICGRLVRGSALSIRENEYILASRATGAHPWWVIVRHILPAVLPPVVVAGTLSVAGSIGLEATLSFLGLGIQPPTASWGNMLNEAQSLTVIRNQPWLWLPPGLAVAITVLGVNFIGDGLRDALDPKQGS